MIITKINDYIIYYEDSIFRALEKIAANKSRIAFLINEHGVLQGTLTDGDFRRWLIKNPDMNLEQKAIDVANTKFHYAHINDNRNEMYKKFDSRKNINYLPLVDKNFRLVAILANTSMGDIVIGNHSISDEHKAFIIAEIGNNHNGDIKLAKELVDLANEAGADCVKFQMRDLKTLYTNSGDANDPSEDLGSQYILDLLKKFQLQDNELFEVFDYCKAKNILPLCTPWDLESLQKLEKYGMLAYKVASADMTNYQLLEAIAKTGKTMIVSTGMSKEDEIIDAVEFLKSVGANYILLHCNSAYPAPYKDINLNYLPKLKKIGNCIVGYSGHEVGISVAIAAIVKGAKVIEKHFTIDKSMEGNDHKVSLLPGEFQVMVKGIREVEQALGSAKKEMSQGEIINRENLAKSLVINCDLKKGEIILANMIEVKSPGKGLQPDKKKLLLSKRVKRDMKKGDFFFESDISRDTIKAKAYKFSLPWGIPVRFHDYKKLSQKSNMKMLEFHLSYKDIEVNLDNFFDHSQKLDMGLVVHAPELFAGDHIINLCSDDHAYVTESIKNLNKVTGITRKIQTYFNQKNTPIVMNVGGFTHNRHIEKSDRGVLYKRFIKNMQYIDCTDVEIIPQTMPPFPWHFGGQSYHNIFVDPDEIAQFCEESGMHICLDVSHSQLACNYYQWNIIDFIQKVGKYSTHLHIADAKGMDGEGLQIDEGDMNFNDIGKALKQHCYDATFIPEIWQGHKNEGEGFWHALNKLDGKL